MFSYCNSYERNLVNPKTVEESGSGLNKKKSKHRFSAFTNPNSEWYQRHETLWEKFIKDHLQKGRHGFIDEKTTTTQAFPVKQSQHFHVDPKKCKEINIDIKNDGHKSVSISFVTSETNVHNLLPVDVYKYLNPLSPSQTTESSENSVDSRLLKAKPSDRNTSAVVQGKGLQDKSIDTRSLEYFNYIYNFKENPFLLRDSELKTESIVVDGGDKELDVLKKDSDIVLGEHLVKVTLPDQSVVKSQVISSHRKPQVISSHKKSQLISSHRKSQVISSQRKLHSPKTSLRFPAKQPIICSKDLRHRPVSSKLLFKNRAEPLNNQCKKPETEKQTVCPENKVDENITAVECNVEGDIAEEQDISLCKLERKINFVDLKTASQDKENKTISNSSLTKDLLPEINKSKVLEVNKSKVLEVNKSKTLEVNKSKTNKSNASIGKGKTVKKVADKIEVKNKKIRDKKSNQKVGSFGWFSLPRNFNIFSVQTPPSKHKVQKEKTSGKETAITESKLNTKDDTKKEILNMPGSSDYHHRNVADNDDDSDGYVKYKHYSHKVRGHAHDNSKSKDVDSQCTYCNRSNEKGHYYLLDLLPHPADSVFFGPTLDEAITNIVSCFPSKILKSLGFFHELNPDLDGPMTRENLIVSETNDGSKSKTKHKKIKDEASVLEWLNKEYLNLANELAEAKTNPKGKKPPEIYESRRFVLDRLHEILEDSNYVDEEKEKRKERRRKRDNEE